MLLRSATALVLDRATIARPLFDFGAFWEGPARAQSKKSEKVSNALFYREAGARTTEITRRRSLSPAKSFLYE
jgi:hypothetical protein